jgi:hypothetical protein
LRAAAERGHARAQTMLDRHLAQKFAGESDPGRAPYRLSKVLAEGQVDPAGDPTARSAIVASNGALTEVR